MTDPRSHPAYRRALDRSLPLEERRASYRAWADEHAPHMHPALGGWHTHAGGNRIHEHRKEESR